ncbi:MAG: nuclear transport factor 2 family protein [Nitrospinaceae bacterium]
MGKLNLTVFAVAICTLIAVWAPAVKAADPGPLLNVLKKVDAQVCTSPKKITQFYSSKIVILSDDKRILPENRVRDYENMVSDLVGIKCRVERKVLAQGLSDQVSFLLVDEMISVTSKSNDNDERQHSVCTYGFVKEGSGWKVAHEHCSSLPDYTIQPGDDALYYFHNPVY